MEKYGYNIRAILSYHDPSAKSMADKMSPFPQLRSKPYKPASFKRAYHSEKLTDFEHYLEAADPINRDGKSLHKYHGIWEKSHTKEDFFHWLNHGQGYRLMLKAHTFESRKASGIKHRYVMNTKMMLTTMATKPILRLDRKPRTFSGAAIIMYKNMITAAHHIRSSKDAGSFSSETVSEESNEASEMEVDDFPDLVPPMLTEECLYELQADQALAQGPSIHDWLDGFPNRKPISSIETEPTVRSPVTLDDWMTFGAIGELIL